MNFLKTLKNFFWLSEVGISSEKRERFTFILRTILRVHILGTVLVFVGALLANKYIEDDKLDFLQLIFTMLVLVSIVSSLLIFITSLKSEIISSQSYEYSLNRSGAMVQSFNDFNGHINWLDSHMTPDKFRDKSVNLYFAISTPAYGIAADHDFKKYMENSNDSNPKWDEISYPSIRPYRSFIDFLEKWVVHYEKSDSEIKPPTWSIALWNKEEHINVFCIDNICLSPNENPKNLEALKQFAALYERIISLHQENKIDLKLFYTQKTSARIFLAHTNNQYRGLMAMFTPLTPSSLCHKKWQLTGFEVRDMSGFKGIFKFWKKLIILDFSDTIKDINEVSDLSNPKEFLKEYFKIDKEI